MVVSVQASWVDALKEGSTDTHLVQFYRDEAFLLNAVTLWSSQVLARGGGFVLVGAPDHRKAVMQALAQQGLDPEALEEAGRLVLLDADDLMAQFMVDRSPSRDAFLPLARDAIARARGDDPTREVRAWGEMVNLLCERGNPAGAMALEDLWNEVLAEQRIRLLCSYRADPFDASLYPARMHVYTHGHSRLLPIQDEAFFEAAVDHALRQVCGDRAADELRVSLAAREDGSPTLEMPPAQRLLAAMNQILPSYGRRVAARAQAHYRAVVQ